MARATSPSIPLATTRLPYAFPQVTAPFIHAKLGTARSKEPAAAGLSKTTRFAPHSQKNGCDFSVLGELGERLIPHTINDLLSGEVKIMFTPLPLVVGFVKEGRLQGIATTGCQLFA
jgi:hypothetical protein